MRLAKEKEEQRLQMEKERVVASGKPKTGVVGAISAGAKVVSNVIKKPLAPSAKP